MVISLKVWWMLQKSLSGNQMNPVTLMLIHWKESPKATLSNSLLFYYSEILRNFWLIWSLSNEPKQLQIVYRCHLYYSLLSPLYNNHLIMSCINSEILSFSFLLYHLNPDLRFTSTSISVCINLTFYCSTLVTNFSKLDLHSYLHTD